MNRRRGDDIGIDKHGVLVNTISIVVTLFVLAWLWEARLVKQERALGRQQLERRIDTIVHMAALHQLVETAAASANASRVLRSRVTEAAAPLDILLFEEKGESSTREHQMR